MTDERIAVLRADAERFRRLGWANVGIEVDEAIALCDAALRARAVAAALVEAGE